MFLTEKFKKERKEEKKKNIKIESQRDSLSLVNWNDTIKKKKKKKENP